MTLTTDEAALLVGVKPTTVYRWVREGKLAPVRADARPIRFREEDVTGVARRHRSARRHARAVRIWLDSIDPGRQQRERRIAAFWSRVRKGAEDDCWLWTGPLSEDGYGYSTWEGRSQTAQRVSWQIHHGTTLPRGMELVVDHLCMNPPCVNPRHLEAVSNAENLRRARVAKQGVS